MSSIQQNAFIRREISTQRMSVYTTQKLGWMVGMVVGD